MKYGHFDDQANSFVITQPLTPRPWINYLGNRRLSAFISQNAGGLAWYLEPQMRRLSRYHYTAAPGDRPGFYVYLRDRATNDLWNPHYAPACAKLDTFACHVQPGVTRFAARRNGIAAEVTYAIPPEDDVMLWHVKLTNQAATRAQLEAVSYLEFGLLEFARELYWAYLKRHIGFTYDKNSGSIRYDYHVFEAPFTPRMAMGCSETPARFDCSRDAFIGADGSLERPAALRAGRDLGNSEAPLGGHGCGALAVDIDLAPGETRTFSYVFAIADTWQGVDASLAKFRQPGAAAKAIADTRDFWASRSSNFQASTGYAEADRFINTWNPYNCLITAEHCRIISTDHPGVDGLRYRDTAQDAMALAHLDPAFAWDRLEKVLRGEKQDGTACFSFWPHNSTPTSDGHVRSDNGVWPIYTIYNLIAETGDFALLDRVLPYRGGGEGTVFEHLIVGLKYILASVGPNGLPLYRGADWNDGLAIFQDPKAESIMLGMQVVEACRQLAELARRIGRDADAAWCGGVAAAQQRILNSDLCWDGQWYRRLIMSDGKPLGSAKRREGRIFLEPQVWSVLSGVGNVDGRGRKAMDAVAELLNTRCGIRICEPPFTGIPEPEDPPLGSAPGTNENGAIFCHANTWAVIAEALLGRPERASTYYRQMLPPVMAETVSADRYEREPYVYNSTIVGPASEFFGQGGISWLTGTASWSYLAATQYLLGVRPTLDGLIIDPCLPAGKRASITRNYRGATYEIELESTGSGSALLTLNGEKVAGKCLGLPKGSRHRVVWHG